MYPVPCRKLITIFVYLLESAQGAVPVAFELAIFVPPPLPRLIQTQCWCPRESRDVGRVLRLTIFSLFGSVNSFASALMELVIRRRWGTSGGVNHKTVSTFVPEFYIQLRLASSSVCSRAVLQQLESCSRDCDSHKAERLRYGVRYLRKT